jgi:hypothetical protein
MKNRIALIHLFLFVCIHVNAKQIRTTDSTLTFSFRIGGHYVLLKEQLILPPPSPIPDVVYDSTFYGFRPKQYYGLSGGLLSTISLKKNTGITFGLFYFNRKKILNGDTASIKKYNPNKKNTHYKINYNNIDGVICFLKQYKRFEFTAGCKFSFPTFIRVKAKDISGKDVNSDINLSGSPLLIPSILVSYCINKQKPYSKVFLSVDYMLYNSAAIQMGLEYRLSTNK